MAVKIKLKRLGKIRAPYYRIVIADSRTKRDGRAIEEIGKYHPKAEPSFIEVNSERAQHWLSVGAQPTDPVRKILEITGDWQKFKGLPGAEGTLRTAEPKADRKVAFAAAVAETLTESGAKAKPKGKAGRQGRPTPRLASQGRRRQGRRRPRPRSRRAKKADESRLGGRHAAEPAEAAQADAAAPADGRCHRPRPTLTRPRAAEAKAEATRRGGAATELHRRTLHGRRQRLTRGNRSS